MYTKDRALKELSKQPKFQQLNSVSYKILAKVVEMIGSDSHDERLLKQLGIHAECIYKSTDSKWTILFQSRNSFHSYSFLFFLLFYTKLGNCQRMVTANKLWGFMAN